VYSEDAQDLGNIADYDRFLDVLETVYLRVAERLTDGGILTVIVKNLKREHILYSLAWDLAFRLCRPLVLSTTSAPRSGARTMSGSNRSPVGIYWVSIFFTPTAAF